jgi:SAM-dependent methyltransferase
VPSLDDLLVKLRRIRYSIASTGLRRGLADTATLLLTYRPDQDSSFDRPFATDTGGSVPRADLEIADAAVREQAILYLPSPERVTRWMLDHVGIDHQQFSFVDLGSGKGRVLLVASEYPFRQIVGVEISPRLSAIARDNIARYRPSRRKCWAVEVANTDATTFEFPETPLLLHLYHPFEPSLTAAVLIRLEESVRRAPRPIVVAYLLYTAAVDPVERVFDGFPWLRRMRYEQSVLGQYNWLFYATDA